MVKKYEIRDESGDLKSIAEEMQRLSKHQESSADEGVITAPTPQVRTKKTRQVAVIAAVAFSVILLGVAIVWLAKNLPESGPAKFAVPNVTGQSVNSAAAAIRQSKLRPKIEFVANAGKKPDTVIATKPAAGAKVANGGTVVLVVAKGAGPSTPPAANEAPAKTNPAEGTNTAATGKAPAPTNEQAPPPLTLTNGNTGTVESGNAANPAADAKVSMPDIEGMVEAKARKKLEDAGMRVEAAAGQDAGQPAGVVLASDPKPGTPVTPGTLVRIKVNTRQEQHAAPAQTSLAEVKSYAGTGAENAAQDLRAHGLTPVTVYEATRMYRTGTVIRTNPPAGSRLPAGSQVTLVVAQ